MACAAAPNASAAELLLCAVYTVPSHHYLLALLAAALTFLYNFLEFHFLHDLLHGLRGDRVGLTFHPASEIYEVVASKCRVLHKRYAPTPWLASPHFQTAFLNYFGRAPVFTYKRQLYSVRDGGTVALDWLLASDVAGHCANPLRTISKDDATPIVVVIPGLTSDSAASYIRHLAHTTAKRGWNVVVSNHRGLGGVSLTTDCFYNAGWTEDVREVLNYLHQMHPNAPLFAVGTSIGANILVKYLGEDGENTPVAGATAICSPWDLVICDRFITRKLVQRFYNRVLTNGLQGYAQLHQSILTRLANWDGITKSRSVRDFDHHATCLVGKFETVDTYYRHCTSANFVGNVSVPLLCISALDDPVCTREAIPWDECRWVGAVSEFLGILYSSPFMHQQKSEIPRLHPSVETTIDKSPYVNIMEDGMVAPLGNDGADIGSAPDSNNDQPNHETNSENIAMVRDQREERAQVGVGSAYESASSTDLKAEDDHAQIICDSTTQVKRSINQLSRQSRRSMWLLAYIAIVTTWPLLGSVFKRKWRGVIPASWFRR